MPEDEVDRRLLRNLCQQTLAFENHYLTVYRDYLLAKLYSEHEADKLFAVKGLREVIYPDEEIISSLRTLEAVDNRDLREAAKETMDRMQILHKT